MAVAWEQSVTTVCSALIKQRTENMIYFQEIVMESCKIHVWETTVSHFAKGQRSLICSSILVSVIGFWVCAPPPLLSEQTLHKQRLSTLSTQPSKQPERHKRRASRRAAVLPVIHAARQAALHYVLGGERRLFTAAAAAAAACVRISHCGRSEGDGLRAQDDTEKRGRTLFTIQTE